MAQTQIPDPDAESLRFDLPADMTIRTAAMLHQQLLPLAAGQAPLVIGGAEVERIDAAGLQLLTALRCGREFQWDAPSAVLVDGARTLRLDGPLHLPGLDPITKET